MIDRNTLFRRRMEAKGYKQIAMWLDAEGAAALRRLQAKTKADRNTTINAALKQAAAQLDEINSGD